MNKVVITGVAGSVGSRVAQRLSEADGVESVAGVDLQHPSSPAPPIVLHQGDIRTMDLDGAFAEASTVIHLASAFRPSTDGTDVSQRVDTAATQRVLAAAHRADLRRLVVLSSAMVYGAWANNPLPLTEEADVRPNPTFAFAEHKAQVETLAAEWSEGRSGARVAVLRPTTAVASGEDSWVARAMKVSASLASDADPPLQFLHLDDLADAVALAATAELDGAYNVAPDGWVKGDDVRQLSGRAPRLRLPTSVAAQVAAASWRHRVAPTPPGIVPYTSQPWVVSNDKIRSAGWSPEYSNVEAYVEGSTARPWAMMNSKRRQQLSLGAASGAVAIGVGVARVAARRLRG